MRACPALPRHQARGMPFTERPNHSLMNRHNYDPHLTEEETKAQRDELICRRSHNQSVAEPGLQPRPAAAEAPLAMGGGLCEGRGCAGLALRPPISPSPTWTATPPPVTAAKRRLPQPRWPPPSSPWSQLLASGRPHTPSATAPPLRCAFVGGFRCWGLEVGRS